MTVGVIVLAAGRGSRMPGAHKLTLDLGGKPVIAHAVDAAAAAGLPRPLVVLGDRALQVRAALGGRDADFVVAARHDDGLSASLHAGLAAAPPEWDAAIVMLGDMPRVGPGTLRALAAVAGRTTIAVPAWRGQRGNPVAWGRYHFPALGRITGDSGGRALLSVLPLTLVEAEDDGILRDIDTPAALAAMRERGTT